jgi:hypothetical protein
MVGQAETATLKHLKVSIKLNQVNMKKLLIGLFFLTSSLFAVASTQGDGAKQPTSASSKMLKLIQKEMMTKESVKEAAVSKAATQQQICVTVTIQGEVMGAQVAVSVTVCWER